MRTLAIAVVWVTSFGCGPSIALPGDEGPARASSAEGGTGSPMSEPGATSGVATSAADTSGPGEDDVFDDGPKYDVTQDTGPLDFGFVCDPWAYEGCADPVASSQVAGFTPLGEFLGPIALFGSFTGCWECLDGPNVAQIVFVADPALLGELSPWSEVDETMVLVLDGWGGFTGPTAEWLTGTMLAHRDGTVTQAPAQFLIEALPDPAALGVAFDPQNAAVIQGELLVEGDGWDVLGSFEAAYCPVLNGYAICE